MGSAKRELRRLADRYAGLGPRRRREDARTIGRLVDSLDEECARIYLARFKAKWDLSGVRLAVGSRPLPSDAGDLERGAYRELLLGAAAPARRSRAASRAPAAPAHAEPLGA